MKLSIITINYNNANGLSVTIKSVLAQTWKNFEYIIIDGGSADESIDIIKQYQFWFAYWVSEPDRGIFHAMNKGIEKASGEYLLMLNSGDYLYDENVLGRVFGENLYSEEILTGDVYREADGKIFTESRYPDVLTFDLFRRNSLGHQSTFIKRQLHNLIGLYDESLRFCSDWKFFLLAICKYNVSYHHLPFFISVCDCGGLTMNPVNFFEMGQECSKVLRQHFPAFLQDYEEFDRMKNRTFKRRILFLKQDIKAHLKKVQLKFNSHRGIKRTA